MKNTVWLGIALLGAFLLAAAGAAAVLPVGITEFSSAYFEINIYGGPIGVLYLRLGSVTGLALAGAAFLAIAARLRGDE